MCRKVSTIALADLLEQLQHVDRAHEQVVEVHRVHAMQLALVAAVDVGDRLLEERADHLRVRVGVAQPVLRIRDLRVDRAGRESLGVDPLILDAAFDQAPRVGLVVDRELPRVPEPVGVRAEHPRARRVERHHPHRADLGARRAAPPARASRAAALFVNVIARISLGLARPVATRCAIRWVSTRVLPEPAPARIRSGPSPWVTASRWGSLSPASKVWRSSALFAPSVDRQR